MAKFLAKFGTLHWADNFKFFGQFGPVFSQMYFSTHFKNIRFEATRPKGLRAYTTKGEKYMGAIRRGVKCRRNEVTTYLNYNSIKCRRHEFFLTSAYCVVNALPRKTWT